MYVEKLFNFNFIVLNLSEKVIIVLDFYSTSSLKQQSAGRHDAALGHIILIPSQPVCPFSLMLRSADVVLS